ncbi:MAG: outer membrane protein assembly factor BamD [Singulisphaera sp.]
MALVHCRPEPGPVRRPDRLPGARPGLGFVLAALAAASGCAAGGTGPLAAWRQGLDSSLSKGPTNEEMHDDRQLMARWLTPRRPRTPTPRPLADGPRPRRLEAADGRAQPRGRGPVPRRRTPLPAGEAPEAERVFARLAKNHKGTPWGEKGLFYTAEAQFQAGRYVAAHDSLERLIADYPGTEYLDKLVNREYTIAQTWLTADDPKAQDEGAMPWYARFNGRRPLVDTQGNALQVLEHVRHHDPTGPLSDDAVMKIADLHMANQDYEKAAEYYDQLISDHPKSPLLAKAQLAAIDSRMKGYIGPEYDGSGLEKASQQVKQHMTLFPERPAGDEKLYHTLDLINDQKAERTFVTGDYYQRIGKVASAEFYFGTIAHRWPKSEWAAKAKTRLAALAKAPREQSLPSKIMTQPGSADPTGSMGGFGGGGPGMGGSGMGGMGGSGMN